MDAAREGAVQGATVLVLGAFGCGAFKNPPGHVAELFNDELHMPNVLTAFAKVIFAIRDDHNAGREHNPRGNYKPFAEIFAE